MAGNIDHLFEMNEENVNIFQLEVGCAMDCELWAACANRKYIIITKF